MLGNAAILIVTNGQVGVRGEPAAGGTEASDYLPCR